MSSQVSSSRNASIELYRVSLMFGICLLHSITFSDCRPWLANILLSCVNGFVLISGWYGIRFAPSKVLRLYSISLYAAVAVVCVGWGISGAVPGPADGLMMIWEYCKAPWFLNAYVFLMLLAPLVDAALDRLDNRQLPLVLIPFFILTFGWSFGTELPFFSDLIPVTAGLGSYTGLTLLCVYVVGRLCRRLGAERLPVKVLLVALLPLVFLTAVGMGDYASPFATLLAAVTFLLFNRLRIPSGLDKVLVVLAPSMFAVYLLHTNRVGIAFLIKAQNYLLGDIGVPLYASFLLSAFWIFGISLIFDFARRIVCFVLGKPIAWGAHVVDHAYVRCVDRFARVIGSGGESRGLPYP